MSALKHILDNTDETREQSNIIELTDLLKKLIVEYPRLSEQYLVLYSENMIPKKVETTQTVIYKQNQEGSLIHFRKFFQY